MAAYPSAHVPQPAPPAGAIVWKMLFDRQLALLHRWLRPEWQQRVAELGLRRDALPNPAALARQLRQRAGWTLLFTGTPIDEGAYYAALARRELPVVSRLRTFGEFDRPPGGPDLFADVLGRLPLLLEPGYADALQQVGQAWELATTLPAARLLRRFVRATFGRGLLAGPDGRPRPYGTTLLTSPRHLHALAAAAPEQQVPLTGAARHLALAAPAAATYYVAEDWTQVQAELWQLRHELRAETGVPLVAQLPESRLPRFAGQQLSLRQAG